MGILTDVTAIAAACAENPRKMSVWDDELKKFVCENDPRFTKAAANQTNKSIHPISSEFKLVFLTASSGTLLFVLICITTTIIAGKHMPPFWEKLIQSLMDMAKIGFGAVAGLLGTKVLDRSPNSN